MNYLKWRGSNVLDQGQQCLCTSECFVKVSHVSACLFSTGDQKHCWEEGGKCVNFRGGKPVMTPTAETQKLFCIPTILIKCSCHVFQAFWVFNGNCIANTQSSISPAANYPVVINPTLPYIYLRQLGIKPIQN